MIRTHARAVALLATLLLAILFVPWTVIRYPDGITWVFAWGLVNLDPVHVTNLYAYLFTYTAGLPRHLVAWPTSVLLSLLSLVSVLSGVALGREDVRITAGLLVAAGVSHATFAFGLQRPGITAVPIATVLLWGLAAYVYLSRPAFRER